MAGGVFHFIEEGNDLNGFNQLLEEGCNLTLRNKDGRTALELAVLLGRRDFVTCLLQKEANVNATNSTGYTPLHIGAMWGHIECIKILVEAGADYNVKTRHKETAKDIAIRYGQGHCVTYLECTEARTFLKLAISQARETLTDSERISGKWNKEDKTKVTALCNEKTDWLERSLAASKEDILSQQQDFEERYKHHLIKLEPIVES